MTTRTRRAASGIASCWKFMPLSRETNKPSSVPTKIAPGNFGFVTTAVTLIRAAVLPPVLLIALANLISLQPFFSSSVRNSPFHVEATIQLDAADWSGAGGESPLPLLGAETIGVKGNIAKT